MSRYTFSGLLLILLIVLFGSASAQDEPEAIIIQAGGVKKIKIAMPLFAGPAELVGPAWEILKKDLEIAGVYDVIDPKLYPSQASIASVSQARFSEFNLIGADYVIVGSLAPSEGKTISMKLEAADISGRVLTSYDYKPFRDAVYLSIHNFTDAFLKDSLGLKPIFNSKIVAVMQTTSGRTLYTCWPDGTGGYPLLKSKPGDIILSPAYSSDGNKIAFVSYVRNNPDLWLINLSQGKATILSSSRGLNTAPAFHPSGSKLALTMSKDGTQSIYMMDLNTKAVSKLVSSYGIDTSASFSPDGSKMVFCSDRGGSPQIYIRDIATGQDRRLTFQGKKNTEPRFSPRGDLVAFTYISGGAFHIATIKPDGSDMKVFRGTDFEDFSPSFSPDGRLLIFAAGDGNLYISDINGSNPVRITSTGARFSQPCWGPPLNQ
jgi:TolB protein